MGTGIFLHVMRPYHSWSSAVEPSPVVEPPLPVEPAFLRSHHLEQGPTQIVVALDGFRVALTAIMRLYGIAALSHVHRLPSIAVPAMMGGLPAQGRIELATPHRTRMKDRRASSPKKRKVDGAA